MSALFAVAVLGAFLLIVIYLFRRSVASSRVSVDLAPEPMIAKDDRPVTGSIRRTGSGSWLLNPSSSFPLTVSGGTEIQATEIERILDEAFSRGGSRPGARLGECMYFAGLRCNEVDQYLQEFRPTYQAEIQKLIEGSKEWESSSEKDREDLLVTFRRESLQRLEFDLIATSKSSWRARGMRQRLCRWSSAMVPNA